LHRSRSLYSSRCAVLLAALDTHLAGRASWTRPRGGFFTWLDIGVDAVGLAQRALTAGVGVVPGPPFFPDGSGARYLRLAFSSAAEDEMEEGVRRLATLL
jgi:2-aminoadipate transaminase